VAAVGDGREGSRTFDGIFLMSWNEGLTLLPFEEFYLSVTIMKLVLLLSE
jgi:hypothetical protein